MPPLRDVERSVQRLDVDSSPLQRHDDAVRLSQIM